MKKILFLMGMPFVFLSGLTAQITQEAANNIALEYLQQEMQPYALYAKENVEGTTITTSLNEVIELDYACWVYYIRYADQPDDVTASRRYLIVKQSDGNLLEINTNNDLGTADLTGWRIIPFLIAQRDFLTGFPSKYFSTIKTEEDWENFKTKMNSYSIDKFTETNIDFSLFQVIVVVDEVKNSGGWSINITDITENSDEILVTVSNLRTGNLTSVITQPFQVVKIPTLSKPIAFNDLTLSYYE
jgi:hypothetical protein